jgi:hypothetical protein
MALTWKATDGWSPVELFRILAVWFLEMLGEAFGTCLVIVVVAFISSWHAHPPLHNDLNLRMIFGISAFVLIEFAMTGYLATTVISRCYLRSKKQLFYPYVTALLYLVHSTIFFVTVGNRLFEKDNLAIQFSGAVVAFACSWLGNRAVAHWNEIRTTPPVLVTKVR